MTLEQFIQTCTRDPVLRWIPAFIPGFEVIFKLIFKLYLYFLSPFSQAVPGGLAWRVNAWLNLWKSFELNWKYFEIILNLWKSFDLNWTYFEIIWNMWRSWELNWKYFEIILKLFCYSSAIAVELDVSRCAIWYKMSFGSQTLSGQARTKLMINTQLSNIRTQVLIFGLNLILYILKVVVLYMFIQD